MYFTKALSVAFLFVCLGLVTFGDEHRGYYSNQDVGYRDRRP
jgi:hypothetical protein